MTQWLAHGPPYLSNVFAKCQTYSDRLLARLTASNPIDSIVTRRRRCQTRGRTCSGAPGIGSVRCRREFYDKFQWQVGVEGVCVQSLWFYARVGFNHSLTVIISIDLSVSSYNNNNKSREGETRLYCSSLSFSKFVCLFVVIYM